jgi:uncharacterized integral membrane protein
MKTKPGMILTILSALLAGSILFFSAITAAQADAVSPGINLIYAAQEQPTPTPTPTPTLDPDGMNYTEQELEAGRPLGIIIGAGALVGILLGSVILGYSLGAGAHEKKKSS